MQIIIDGCLCAIRSADESHLSYAATDMSLDCVAVMQFGYGTPEDVEVRRSKMVPIPITTKAATELAPYVGMYGRYRFTYNADQRVNLFLFSPRERTHDDLSYTEGPLCLQEMTSEVILRQVVALRPAILRLIRRRRAEASTEIEVLFNKLALDLAQRLQESLLALKLVAEGCSKAKLEALSLVMKSLLLYALDEERASLAKIEAVQEMVVT
jgi:hypothetical protein